MNPAHMPGRVSRLRSGYIDSFRTYITAEGYLDPEDSSAHAERVLNVIRMVCEPIRYDEVYDFGRSDMAARARDAGLEMALKSGGELRAPPPETAPTSGTVQSARGTRLNGNSLSFPKAFSAATTPMAEAAWLSIQPPVTSPTA